VISSETKSSKSTHDDARWLLWVRILLLVAILGAGYLGWLAIHNGPAIGCGPESGCNKVLQSRWAYWLDIPVSFPAFLVYCCLFGSTIMVRRASDPDEERGAWIAMIVLSVTVIGAALWFVGLQVFVIKSFCKFCMTAHICGAIASVLCLCHIPTASDKTTPLLASGSGKSGITLKGISLLVVSGFLCVSVLVAGQIIFKKERNVVKVVQGSLGEIPALAGKSNIETTTFTNDLPAPHANLIAPGTLSVYGKKFLLKMGDVPVMGSTNAPYVIVYLFDYTCVHCRAMHPLLLQACQRLTNQLAVICLPVPNSSECNPFYPKTAVKGVNTNACAFVRIGLAVWKNKPEAYAEFENWMFTGTEAPSLKEVQERAAKLIGAETLNKASEDVWIKQQILMDCRIHRANWQATGNTALPQLILGDAVSAGPLNSTEHLLLLLNKYLKMDVGKLR